MCIRERLKAAKSTKEFYQLNAQLTEDKIIERVSNAYFQVFTIQQKKGPLESSYSSTEKARNIIKSLYDNGLAKKVDSVSYTHLDVYKRQKEGYVIRNQEKSARKNGGKIRSEHH